VKLVPKPYNAESVARFLGWLQPNGDVAPRVRSALSLLELIEEAELEEEEIGVIIKGLSTDQGKCVTREMKSIKQSWVDKGKPENGRAKMLAGGKEMSDKLRAKEVGVRDLPAISNKYKAGSNNLTNKFIEQIDKWDDEIIAFVDGVFDQFGSVEKMFEHELYSLATRKDKQRVVDRVGDFYGRMKTLNQEMVNYKKNFLDK
jgi:hypothetical protein